MQHHMLWCIFEYCCTALISKIIDYDYFDLHTGADNCLLVKDAPCGGRPAEMPEVTFE